MSEVTQNPNFHLSKPPHKLTNKQGVLKNKPTTKRSGKPRCNNTSTNISTSTTINKPLKVVHISNPMKFQATAAEFRDLVQGLTGRDAVFDWPDEQLCGVQQVNAGTEDNSGVIINDDLLHEQVHKEVDLSACFGPSDHFGGFDYFIDDHHMVVMEDLRAFIGGDDDLMVRGM